MYAKPPKRRNMSKLMKLKTIKTRVKRRVFKKWVKRFLKYIRNPKNEFGFFVVTLQKKVTGLPAIICLDDNGDMWRTIGNKKIILFQTNTYPVRDFKKMLPMTIEDEPDILAKNEKIDLSQPEIEAIKNFVRNYRKEILELGISEKMSIIEFGNELKKE